SRPPPVTPPASRGPPWAPPPPAPAPPATPEAMKFRRRLELPRVAAHALDEPSEPPEAPSSSRQVLLVKPSALSQTSPGAAAVGLEPSKPELRSTERSGQSAAVSIGPPITAGGPENRGPPREALAHPGRVLP